MKFSALVTSLLAVTVSRPARGAWVEIWQKLKPRENVAGRAPQGARGLKCYYCYMD